MGSSTMRRAYEALPESERKEFLDNYLSLRNERIRAGVIQVMARNLSHNYGKFVKGMR